MKIMGRHIKAGLLLCLLMVLAAQCLVVPSHAEPNPAQRAEIRAKRIGVPVDNEEGLAASRAFLRIDSTYYVGWMYQGLYLEARAADLPGYKKAIPTLERALDLLEKDYASVLSIKTKDAQEYYRIRPVHEDYSAIAEGLFNAYQYTDRQEAAYQLLRRVLRWDMQKHWVLQPYNMLAWLTHRNRFYTKAQFSFLGNSIAENEAKANAYLDSGLVFAERMKPYNQGLFSEYLQDYERLSVYHYKCILHAYNFEIDSAAKYFSLMEETVMFPYNNHGTFLAIQARFREALEEYDIAAMWDMGDKRLLEWAYYASIIKIYSGQPLSAAIGLRDLTQAVGSTPGFGWYNIALARACAYQGNMEETQRYIDRAAGFRELHIGTTLGQTHYEFALNLLRLQAVDKAIAQMKFENKSWYWKPSCWWQLIKLKFKRLSQKYLLTNQFAQNPEREQVIYKIFSTESVVSWDEIWYLIRDFSSNFFYKKFEQELKQDGREQVYKYYQLFLAKLDIGRGNYRAASQRLQTMLQFREDIDAAYERLFLARVYEALAICAHAMDDEQAFGLYAAQMYALYPQLLPYADFAPQMRLFYVGENKEIDKHLRNFDIDWVANSRYAPKVIIHYLSGQDALEYSVVDYKENVIVPKTTILIHDPEEAAKTLAYGLFNIVSLDTQPNVDEAN